MAKTNFSSTTKKKKKKIWDQASGYNHTFTVLT